MIAPEWVAVSGFWRRRSLSDLAVWGFPEFPGKSSPSIPSPPLSTPFSPFDPFLQFLHPLKPSLQLFRSGFFTLSTLPTLFFLLRTLSFFPNHFLGSHQPLSEHLRNPSIDSPKSPKRPFLGLFSPFWGFPPKRAKIPLFRPFLTPFSPLPYPL